MKNTISFNTKFGWISACETNNNITKVQFGRKKNSGSKSRKLRDLEKKILLFLKAREDKLDIKIFLKGNILQKKIWKELKKIKKGKTKTYGEIAKKMRVSPRYIGRVCGKNKHILIIPCHRVIKSDNTLGGFSAPGGLKLKRKLLEFEGAILE